MLGPSMASRGKQMMGRVKTTAVVLGVGAAASLSAPGGALASSESLRCVSKSSATFAPGLSTTRSAGTYSSGGGAPLTCAGSFKDMTVLGSGSWRYSGDYGSGAETASRGDDCISGSGSGRFDASVPVTTVFGERRLDLEGTYTFVQIGMTRFATGSGVARLWRTGLTPRPGSASYTDIGPFTFSGLGAIAPQQGNCLVSRLTGAAVSDNLEFAPGGSPSTVAGEHGETAAAACAHRILGSVRADRLDGTDEGDSIRAGGGADVARGLSGADCIRGDAGADRLSGGAGADAVRGGTGADKLLGGSGADALVGGSGRDKVVAGSGADLIQAADGRRDHVACGSGRDRVVADRADVLTSCERIRRR